LSSNTATFEKMSGDIDVNAGGVIDGTESIQEVGTRLLEHIRKVAGGEIQAKAEIHKHREFQFWAEQTVSL
jgi:altronate hydrolase